MKNVKVFKVNAITLELLRNYLAQLVKKKYEGRRKFYFIVADTHHMYANRRKDVETSFFANAIIIVPPSLNHN